jgi:predicted O-methyltransferase YrrM
MSEEQWAAVDRYLEDRLIGDNEALNAALAASTAAGLPNIAVSASQGKLLNILAASVRAKRILEIGTLGGYSAIWMARALPAGGKLISLEAEPRHAEVARENLRAAGLGDKVDIWIGDAMELLPKVAAAGVGPFDFAFIDADKEHIPEHFDWAVKMARPGSLIVVDNIVRRGRLIDADTRDPDVLGVRRLHDNLANDDRVTAVSIQTVGAKGYDGFTLALVR